jgi:hypothetical protein
MPDALFILSKDEKKEFLDTLKTLKPPKGYVSNLHKRISGRKLSCLKSHDYHVLIQQILPVCLRNVGDPKVVGVIMRVNRIFQRFTAKVVDPDSREELLADVATAFVTLEKEMPPSFLDIITHLPQHLAEELFICGPVHSCWMYSFKRYMKALKSHMRNLACLEGSIAQGYQV